MTLPSNSASRRQASMYVSDAPVVESLRLKHNAVQASLIPAHVTLCREDEVDDWSALETRIRKALPIQITLGFGGAVRDENCVFLPAISGIEQFDALRKELLFDGSKQPRKQVPHITIIHPRNGTCSDAAFDEIEKRLMPFTVTLRKILLIEQTVGGPWVRLAEFGSLS